MATNKKDGRGQHAERKSTASKGNQSSRSISSTGNSKMEYELDNSDVSNKSKSNQSKKK